MLSCAVAALLSVGEISAICDIEIPFYAYVITLLRYKTTEIATLKRNEDV